MTDIKKSLERARPVTPNPSFQGTAGKLCLPVPSALRAPAAPEVKRYALG